MAIFKNIPSNFGIDTTHWKASSIAIDYIGMQAQSVCLGYLSEDAMNANKQSTDTDIVHVLLYWSQEALDATKPPKPTRLVELEDKDTLTPEEEDELSTWTSRYSAELEQWAETPRQVVNAEIMQAFQTMLQYQYQFHLQSKKLKDGTLIQDNLPV